MNNVLLWVGGLMVAVLALLFAVPYVVDWNSYRGVFEEEVSRLLGRDVRVGGRVDLRLLPKPFVRFEKVRIADVGAMQGEPFFRAESFTLWLSVPPLLRGAIEANDVELEHPVLSLAVDERGVGNWKSLQVSAGALPFVPSDVALQAVRVHEGTVMVRDLASRASFTFTGIDGEFGAPALNGPYRFRGDLDINGEKHEVRLSTSTQEADGKFRLKLTARAAGSQNSYTLDGAVSEVGSRLRLDGNLTARLPLGPASGGQANPGDPGVAFDLQSQIALDNVGAKLSDLTLGFEQDGTPQVLNGSADIAWGEKRATSVSLQSRWLDLDRISGAGSSGARPLDVARDLAGRLATLMPSEGTSRASLTVDQVNLGGEAVDSVVMTLARRGGVLELEELSGLVPGFGRLGVQGKFGAAQGKAPFTGTFALRGASLQRFLGWALPGQAPLAGSRAEGAFSLAGSLTLSGERIGLTNAALELSGSRLAGSVEYRFGSAPELKLALEGDVVDAGLLPAGLAGLDIWRRILGGGEASSDAPASGLARIADQGLLKLEVRAGRVTDGATTLYDVVADITARRGKLDIPTLKLRTANGLSIDGTAALETANGHRQGRLNGWIAAPSSEATLRLASLLGAEAGGSVSEGLRQLAPLDTGFTASLEAGASRRVTVRVDGSAAGSRIGSTVVLDGGVTGWRNASIDVSARVESPDIAGFAARISGQAGNAAASEAATAAGQATLKLAGPSAASLGTLVEIESAALNASFQGRARLPEGGASADVEGDLTVSSGDVAGALDIVAPRLKLRPKGLSAEGVVRIARTGETLRLTARRLDIGGKRVTGDLELRSAGQVTRVDGRLTTGRAAVVDLVGSVLDTRQKQAAGDAGALPSIWSDAAFDFTPLDGVDGRLALSVASLDVGGSLALTDASLNIELGAGSIAIPRIEGHALDGTFSGRMALERAAGGAALELAGKLGPVPLATAVGPASAAAAGGTATVEFDVKGRAASLRGLALAVAGSGVVTLSDARVPALDPAAIDKVADAALAGPAMPSRLDLAAAIRRALAGTAVAVGSQRLKLDIGDGSARVGALEVAVNGGRLTNATTVDLATLKADSEWTLASTRRKSSAGGELPSVTLVYLGPLGEVSRVEPKISVESLERELTVRRMERDVERMETLRRQDEQRARQQREGAAPGTPPGGLINDVPMIEAPFPVPGGKGATVAPPPPPPPARATTSSGVSRAPPRTGPRPRTMDEVFQAQ
jgi:hypothetical protein